VSTGDLVRPQGDDAPWSSELDVSEDGSGALWVGVENRKRRPMVFLGESDERLRGEISEGLRQAGYLVSASSSPWELEMDLTFTYLNGSESDVDAWIVSGLRMPGQDEFAIARHLHQQSWCPPMLLATDGGADRDTGPDEKALGIAGLIDRPFTLASVCRTLAELARPGPSALLAR
jgi:CheY-like chemotaxis protein